MSSSQPSPSLFAEHLLRQFEMPRRMLAALADDFTDEEATTPVAGLKPLVWYLGHTLVSEAYFLQLYAGKTGLLDEEHMKRFGRGSNGEADLSDVKKADLVAAQDRLHGEMKAFLLTLTPEDLSREAEGDVAHPLFKTLGAAISLVVAHDAYHSGQIADLRRAMGKNPLFG